MLECSVNFITGMMVGIEFPPPAEIDENLSFAMAIDLLILRIVLLYWKKEQ